MSLQPTEAAFEGFRIVRRTPMVLVWWTLLYAAISLLSYWIMTSNIDALIAFSERAEEFQAIAEGGGQPSSAELGAFMQAWAAAMAPFSWLIPL